MNKFISVRAVLSHLLWVPLILLASPDAVARAGRASFVC